ncbi:MAG: hypothetical protein C5B58_06315, partial [Acidobacteria bacterium]
MHAGHYQCRFLVLVAAIVLAAILLNRGYGQTPSTGALVGATLDPSGALIPGTIMTLVNQATGTMSSITSDEEGRFGFSLLTPGSYQLCASKADFAPLCNADINIHVTETLRIDVRLQLATVVNPIEVSAETSMVQSDTSALGRVVNKTAISDLPLVTRNFAQVASLSPGVVASVSNAGELGLGGTALPQINQSNDGIFVHGSRSYDNNWQLDGMSVSDVHGNAGSGGIPVPSPDSIEEFKVQTGLYDAAYGRYAGANVSVITKSGGSKYHATVFEFFRNTLLNANDYFRNQTNQPRPVLMQNQFGFIFGGPIEKEKLSFLGSYQGTRQVNGLAAGQARIACAAGLTLPPLTDDRTTAALGGLFGGLSGVEGGVAVKADGSNINSVALALLNFKLPDGSYLIPTPQSVDTSRPFASQGFSVFSQPCHFNENQFLTNIDYLFSQRNKLSARLFWADDSRTVAFPGNFYNPEANIHGFSSPSDGEYRVLSLSDIYTISNSLLNEARIGYARTKMKTDSDAPFKWSDLGVTEGDASEANELPNLNILGSVAFASAFPFTFTQNSFVFSDTFSIVRGAHALRFGGSLTRFQDNFADPGLGSFVQFLSWPDFLLGLNAIDNGTKSFSNVFASIDDFGLFDRAYRVWEGSAFAQEDYKIRKSLTLNFGLRYERLGQFTDKGGRNSSFDVNKADPNPPASGSIAGYVVASNFPGVVPPDV